MIPTDPPAADRTPTPPLAPLVGRRPVAGAGNAAKNVIADVQTLVKAEVALAKAELTAGLKSKAKGAGLFVGVAVVGWLAIQVFLVFLGFLFALFLPAWAAVGLVLLLLVVVMGVLGYLGYRKFQAQANLKTTMQTVRESQQAATQAVSQAQDNVRGGVETAKTTVTKAGQDLATDVKRRVGGHPKDLRPGLTPLGSGPLAGDGSGATPIQPAAANVSADPVSSGVPPSPLSTPPDTGPTTSKVGRT